MQDKKQLTFDDLLKLSKKNYAVKIGDYGCITVRRPTLADQEFAYAGSEGGKDLLKYQKLLVTRIAINPQLSESEIDQLPDGFCNIIIGKVNKINEDLKEKEEEEDFLE